MPTYEFECRTCDKVTETFFRMNDVPESVPCRICGCDARRILSRTAVHCDSVEWIDDTLRGCLQKDGEKPIETKSELKDYCKAHDIVQTG